MENSYEQGFAFILEAATELAFYDILLNFLAERHPECKLEKRTSDEIYEPFYVVQGPFGTRVIRMNAVGTILKSKTLCIGFKTLVSMLRGKRFHGLYSSVMIRIPIMRISLNFMRMTGRISAKR